MSTHLPIAKEIRDLFVELLDRAVVLSPGAPLAPTQKAPCTVGVYVDDRLQVTALIVLDTPLSAYIGAAIGLVPPHGAEAAILGGMLQDNLRENVHEVYNIAASLFNVGDADHLRLYDVHHAGDPLPPDILIKSLTLGRREDLSVEVGGYGSGRLSVVLIR
jgi:hypothetical protein